MLVCPKIGMKKYLFIISMLAWCTCACAFTALAPEKAHFVSLHGDLGYSTLLHNIQGRKPSPGMNFNIGVDYRLHYNNFLFSAGVEGLYELHSNPLDAMDFALPMVDTEGDLFNMHVIVDKSSDLSHMVNLNIPLLVGGEFGRFYFLVGPKVSLNMYGAASSKAEFTTYGEYERYYDDFYDMPNHQFESGHVMQSGTLPLKWNMNVMAHLELGARVNHMYRRKAFRLNPDRIRMYLALYADYGLLNLHTQGSGAPAFEYRETDEGVKFFIQPMLLSTMSDNAVINNLSIGIKYTIAFELPQRGKSYIYDWKRDQNTIKRGGNQTIKF